MHRNIQLASVVASFFWVGDAVRAGIVYRTDFDALGVGPLLANPGDPAQDGWISTLADGTAFSEIQTGIAQSGQALHQHGPASNAPGLQTFAIRAIVPPNLTTQPRVVLHADFFCASSNLGTSVPYDAALAVGGGPHPGFTIVAFNLGGGNGSPRATTGVYVGIAAFNGADNNEPIPLTIGQGLAWGEWHTLTLVIDRAVDRFVSVLVDGESQNLSMFQPPRSFVEGMGWLCGDLMESIVAAVNPQDVTADDEVYWDNVSVSVVETVPTVSAWGLVAMGLLIGTAGTLICGRSSVSEHSQA